MKTLIDIIRKVIEPMTIYTVPRMGKILKVDDPINEGRVLCAVPMLGWDTEDQAIWCYPRDKNSLITPAVGDYVLIEWIDGKKETAVYSGQAAWMQDMRPGEYKDANSQILFQSANDAFVSIYNEQEKKLTIKDSNGNKIEFSGQKMILGAGGQPFVNGNMLIAWLLAHTHNGVTPGGGISGVSTMSTSGILSTRIEGE